ncbi:hypothetical protein LMG28727_01295 [Paraburkholderia kirstenboschensis]|nr:hypothetical protein LMG28727_01295 [Paraburkholderia kirstenboschensis]
MSRYPLSGQSGSHPGAWRRPGHAPFHIGLAVRNTERVIRTAEGEFIKPATANIKFAFLHGFKR